MKTTRSASKNVVNDPEARIAEIMSGKVVTVAPKATASAAWARMRRRGIRHLVVTANGKLHGIISDRDLGGLNGASMRKGLLVEDLMVARVVSVNTETTVGQAADLMRTEKIGSLPVMDDGLLVGIVTATDVFDELGRSSTRAPFPGWVPKPLKLESSSTKAPLIPAHIRVFGVKLSSEKRASIRQRLGRKLGKFANSVERITVRVEDVNGPRGGVDQMCQIKVVLSGLPSVVFEAQDTSLDAAIGTALNGVENRVRRTLQRRRMEPIKAAARPAGRAE
jgi:CBS domain-containing protein/ribosome-associated translation inhibitor RaiA